MSIIVMSVTDGSKSYEVFRRETYDTIADSYALACKTLSKSYKNGILPAWIYTPVSPLRIELSFSKAFLPAEF